MKFSTMITMILAFAFAALCRPINASTAAVSVPISIHGASIVPTTIQQNVTSAVDTPIFAQVFSDMDMVKVTVLKATIITIAFSVLAYMTVMDSLSLFLGVSPMVLSFFIALVWFLCEEYCFVMEEEGDNDHDNNSDEPPTKTIEDDDVLEVYTIHQDPTKDTEEEDCAGCEDCMPLTAVPFEILAKANDDAEDYSGCDDCMVVAPEIIDLTSDSESDDDDNENDNLFTYDDESYEYDTTFEEPEEEPRAADDLQEGDRVYIHTGTHHRRTGVIFGLRGTQFWDIKLDKLPSEPMAKMIYKAPSSLTRIDY